MRPSKYLLAAFAAGFVASPFVFVDDAEARPNTRSYTCDRLEDLIDDRGAVVMNYKGNSIYHKFVVDSDECEDDEVAQRLTVRAKDGRCRLKYCRKALDDLD